jgi:hypothetical protein
MDCCLKVFKLCEKVPACLTELKIQTDRISTLLKITIIDKFDSQYVFEKTSDSTGIVTILLKDDSTDPNNIILADIPYFLLNQYAGFFLITIYDTVLENTVMWSLNEAISFECASVTPVVEEYTIDPNTQDGEQNY